MAMYEESNSSQNVAVALVIVDLDENDIPGAVLNTKSVSSAKRVHPQRQACSSPAQNAFVVRCQKIKVFALLPISAQSICTLSTSLEDDDGCGSTSQIRHFSDLFFHP